jgi:hypothetical protein
LTLIVGGRGSNDGHAADAAENIDDIGGDADASDRLAVLIDDFAFDHAERGEFYLNSGDRGGELHHRFGSCLNESWFLRGETVLAF